MIPPYYTSNILMIRPAHFGYNAQTAANNAFQSKPEDDTNISTVAIREFDAMVDLLRSHGVHVEVWQDSDAIIKPDAIFPNNWFSTTPDGALITYPMFAPNRRVERDESIVDFIEKEYEVDRRYSMEQYEAKEMYLEGTGSLIIDHDHKVIYACLSPRTDVELVYKLAVLLGYEQVTFHAVDGDDVPIYHTNVMMCIAADIVVICLDAIKDIDEKEQVVSMIHRTGKQICPINMKQVSAYAGNMIQLKSTEGDLLMVMSHQAYKSLTTAQKAMIEASSQIVAPQLPVIEQVGGGSARCMIGELFLTKK